MHIEFFSKRHSQLVYEVFAVARALGVCVGSPFFVSCRANQWLERTGCKSGLAPKKSMEKYALFVLGVAPVPAFQLGRYAGSAKS
jgi:hypothetical protein